MTGNVHNTERNRIESSCTAVLHNYLIDIYNIGVQGWLSGSLVMMLSESYGMFWVQTQPCTPE